MLKNWYGWRHDRKKGRFYYVFQKVQLGQIVGGGTIGVGPGDVVGKAVLVEEKTWKGIEEGGWEICVANIYITLYDFQRAFMLSLTYFAQQLGEVTWLLPRGIPMAGSFFFLFDLPPSSALPPLIYGCCLFPLKNWISEGASPTCSLRARRAWGTQGLVLSST